MAKVLNKLIIPILCINCIAYLLSDDYKYFLILKTGIPERNLNLFFVALIIGLVVFGFYLSKDQLSKARQPFDDI